ncbi:hypothetical protein D3C76_1358280 [compost metagenome]
MFSKMRDDELHAMRIRKLQADIAESRRAGIDVRFMHMSALAPDSRPTHVARHGELFTGEEMLSWWSADGNGKGCRCSCTPVLVDTHGEVLTPGLIDRAKAMLKNYKPAP